MLLLKRLALFLSATILGLFVCTASTPIFTLCGCGSGWSSLPFLWAHLIGGTTAIMAIYTAWRRIDCELLTRPAIYPTTSAAVGVVLAIAVMFAMQVFFWEFPLFPGSINIHNVATYDLREISLLLIFCLDNWALFGMPLTMLLTIFSLGGWRFHALSAAALALYWAVTTNHALPNGHPFGIDLAGHPSALNLRLTAMARITSPALKNFLIAAAGSLTYCAMRERQFALGRRQPT